MKFFYAALAVIFTMVSGCAYSQLWKQYSDSAKAFSEEKNTDKAIEFYTKAKGELKKDSLWTISYITTCNNLVTLYMGRSQYLKAESLILEVMEVRGKIFGKTHPEYARSCNILAIVYWNMGQYEKAEPLYLEAKQIREKVLGKEHSDYTAVCNNLGNLYNDMGLYQKAEPLLSEAKQINEKILGKEHPDYAYNCINLGKLYWETGLYAKAELLYSQANQIIIKTFGKAHLSYAVVCNNLALIYWRMGEYEKSELLHLEAKQNREKALGKEHSDYAKICNNLGNLYNDMGLYQKAEALYEEAKQINQKVLGKENPDYALSCNNLAVLCTRMGFYPKAELLYLEAKQIREKALGKEHPDYATSCNNLALLYEIMGLYPKAEPLYFEARQIIEKVLGKDHPDYAGNCNNLALLYERMDLYSKAEPLYLEGRKIFAKALGMEHPDYIRSCFNLGNLYRRMQMREKAIKSYSEAFDSKNMSLKKIFQFTSEVEKQSYLKTFTNLHQQDNFFSFCLDAYPHATQGITYDVSLSSRNLILSSAEQLRQEMYASGDTSIRRKFTTWMENREQLAFWYTKPVAKRAAYVTILDEQTNTLEKELSRISSTFKQVQARSTITWKDIRQQLKPHEATIEFVQFNYYNGRRMTDSTYYVALLLKKDRPEPMLIPLFESRQLNKLLGSGNTLNTIYSLYRNSDKPSPAYHLIWQPIEKQLAGISKIYFASSGLLHRISFAALPVNGQQVLGDKYHLVQLNTTANVVSQTERFIYTTDSIYLYGGIKYNVDSLILKQAVRAFGLQKEEKRFFRDEGLKENSWEYLPGTEKEISQIASLGKQKKYSIALSGGELASEESLKAMNDKHSPSILHIATHGFFFPDPKETKKENSEELTAGSPFKLSDNPLFRSGLLFAGANNAWTGNPVSGIEDGILTAYEVSNLYLPNTKLVVLSACETGLGDIQGNEGVYGLQRAFKMAGVENLVMSLWKVPDQTTTEFMQEFYKSIFNKLSVSDAFYHAQTIMKNRYRKQTYKWAAWVLIR